MLIEIKGVQFVNKGAELMLHAVLALSQGVACLGTSWNHKYEALFAEYTRSDYLLQPDVRPTELQALLAEAIANVYEPNYQRAISDFKLQAQQMWQTVARHVR